MRNLNEDELNEVEEFSHSLLLLSEIAAILQIPYAEFREECLRQNTPLNQAYMRGKLRSKAAIQKAVVLAAQSGSTPAISQAVQFINEQENEIAKDE